MLLKPRKKELKDQSEAAQIFQLIISSSKSAGLEEVQDSELAPRLLVLKESEVIQKVVKRYP